jgi:hypothetical protein
VGSLDTITQLMIERSQLLSRLTKARILLAGAKSWVEGSPFADEYKANIQKFLDDGLFGDKDLSHEQAQKNPGDDIHLHCEPSDGAGSP